MPLLLDYHSASGSAVFDVLSLPTPGILNTVNSSVAGAEIAGRNSTSAANFPPCPIPKCQRLGQSRVGGWLHWGIPIVAPLR